MAITWADTRAAMDKAAVRADLEATLAPWQRQELIMTGTERTVTLASGRHVPYAETGDATGIPLRAEPVRQRNGGNEEGAIKPADVGSPTLFTPGLQ